MLVERRTVVQIGVSFFFYFFFVVVSFFLPSSSSSNCRAPSTTPLLLVFDDAFSSRFGSVMYECVCALGLRHHEGI